MYTTYELSSPHNLRYKNWIKLLEARGTKKHEQALLAGRKIVSEVLTMYPDRVHAIVARKADDVQLLPIPADCPVYLLPHEMFAALDIYGIKEPILIISAPPLPQWDGTLREGLTVFLPFQNPINLGTTIRTAAALGASVVLLQEAATPYLPKSLRASGPAIFQTPLFQGPSLEELATYTHLPIYALSPKGQNLFTFTFAETMGMVAGMEGPGLDAFWPLEKRLSIPMSSNVESLNAAVSMGIAIACRLALK